MDHDFAGELCGHADHYRCDGKDHWLCDICSQPLCEDVHDGCVSCGVSGHLKSDGKQHIPAEPNCGHSDHFWCDGREHWPCDICSLPQCEDIHDGCVACGVPGHLQSDGDKHNSAELECGDASHYYCDGLPHGRCSYCGKPFCDGSDHSSCL